MWKWLGAKPPLASPTKPSKKSTEAKIAYEKKRVRQFKENWSVGRPWLRDTENGMVCDWCREFENILVSQNSLNSKVFINGCQSYKSESLIYHEKSNAHAVATKCFQAKCEPDSAPAKVALKKLNSQYSEKLRILFRNAQALAKHMKPFRDFTWLCDLDEVKGLNLGQTYRNEKACKTFTEYIASDSRDSLKDNMKQLKFISVTSDGTTDSSITEQEIVFIRYCVKGNVHTKFVAIKSPKSPDAIGLYNSIMDALADIGLTEQEVKKKLVGFGCDGASVMIGKKGGVSSHLKKISPELVTVHCFAHRLELAYKDAIKKISCMTIQ